MSDMSTLKFSHESHELGRQRNKSGTSEIIFGMRATWAALFSTWDWRERTHFWHERHERNHFWHERHELAYFRHERHEPDYFRHIIWILAFSGVDSCGKFSDADLYSVVPSSYTFFFVSGIAIRPHLGGFCEKSTGCRTKCFRVY